MKIAIVGTRGIPNNYGGFEQFAEYISVGLVQKGHDVTVYSPDFHNYGSETYLGVKIRKIYCPESKFGSFAHFIYDYLSLKDALKNNFDVIYEAGYGTSAPSMFLLNKRSPVFITNMDGLEWMRSKWNFLTKALMRSMERIAVKRSKYLIADNIGIQEYYKTSFGKDSFYLPYGAELVESFDPAVLGEMGLTQNGFYVLIARLEPENNIETILDGFVASGSQLPFIVVGNHFTKYGAYLVDKYKHTGGLVRFAGSIYDKVKIDALRCFCQIYFHGHSVGGTNPSLLEAMAAKAFIISHDNSFNRTVLPEESVFFKNSADVAGYLKDVGTLDGMRRRIIEGNLAKIKASYQWNLVIDAYEKLFKQLTGQ
ncbi:MAG TPA: DUF1972 domain-containing protein [Panacibacter sp.]|nr:DUF1972 domain-containing protein [Panacibacter sp.]HNP46704.1 DUF1972 domain-containing protein [Panacibacter sp.]